MAPKPKTLQQIAVERLMDTAQALNNVFEANYQNESNRNLLRDAVESYNPEISKHLNNLVKGNLSTPLKIPKSVYNQFISTWNDGKGDMIRSYNNVADFWRLLSSSRPEIDRLMAPTAPLPDTHQPPPLAKPTTADKEMFQKLATAANELLQPFEACVKVHQPAEAGQIAELVRQISELLKADPSQAAQRDLAGPKSAWSNFFRSYNAGQGINPKSFAMLEEFEQMMQSANNNIRAG